MNEREFRELQVSSTQLAIIFLGIIVLGVVIFLLGVSVGKRHAREAERATPIAQEKPEAVTDKIVLPGPQASRPEEPKLTPQKELTAKKEAVPEQKGIAPVTSTPEAREKPAPPPPSPVPPRNLYYIQVGALTDRASAQALAQQFKNQGFSVVVLEPLSTDRVPYYRVRLGGFATRAEAEAVKDKLTARSGRKDYFIVRD